MSLISSDQPKNTKVNFERAPDPTNQKVGSKRAWQEGKIQHQQLSQLVVIDAFRTSETVPVEIGNVTVAPPSKQVEEIKRISQRQIQYTLREPLPRQTDSSPAADIHESSTKETKFLRNYEKKWNNALEKNDIKIAKQQFLIHSTPLGTQTLFREPVKDKHIIFMKTFEKELETEIYEVLGEIDNINNELFAPPVSDKKIQLQKTLNNLIKQKNLCIKDKENAEDLDRDFVPSGYVRDQLEQYRSLDYAEEVEYLCKGAPVNQRYNQVNIEGALVGGHCDLGVIAYQPNSLTNLAEMKEMATNPGKLREKIASLEKLKRKIEKNKDTFESKKALQSINFALSQINSPETLGNAIIEREFFLTSQFLHLLTTQTEKNFKLVEDYTTFTMTQLSLLNPKISNIDSTGWIHNEYHQMQDMKAIYDIFNGKQLILDGKGPYVDRNGVVHLPFEKENKTLTLQTLFFNVSVQGHTKNDHKQKEINKASIERLLNFVKSIDPIPQEAQLTFENIKKRLDAGESSYKLAEDLGYAITNLPIALGINCLSAKDRTGYVSSRVILRHVLVRLKKKKESGALTPSEYTSLKKAFNLSILEENSCASQNVFDNTGTRILKCSVFNLPGYTTRTTGKVRRLLYYAKQSSLFLAASRRRKEVHKRHREEHLSRRASSPELRFKVPGDKTT